MNRRRRRHQKWNATIRRWRHVWATCSKSPIPPWIDRITHDIATRAGGSDAPRITVDVTIGAGGGPKMTIPAARVVVNGKDVRP